MSEVRKPNDLLLGRLAWWLLIRPALLMDLDLWFMSLEAFRNHLINKVIVPICDHRDQRGDDRCWFDDLSLYWQLPESVRYPVRLTTAQMEARCAYYHRCRSNLERPSQSQPDPRTESEERCQYVSKMTRWELIAETRRLRKAVRKHRDKGIFKRTVADDKDLYALVGSGVEADFRLPPAELFLPNCALICSLVDSNNVDLSRWPGDRTSPLSQWHPDDVVD